MEVARCDERFIRWLYVFSAERIPELNWTEQGTLQKLGATDLFPVRRPFWIYWFEAYYKIPKGGGGGGEQHAKGSRDGKVGSFQAETNVSLRFTNLSKTEVHCVIGTRELSQLEAICVYVAKENILA